MQLFYAPDIVPPLHTLNEEESKHCIRVLRLQCGGRIHITDGRGNLFCCEITDDNPRRCTVRVVSAETGFEKLPYALTMAVAPTKNSERFEWFLEKATEVGVTAVVPLETEHSERRVFKPERGEKVVTAALKQSLKAYRPVLHPLTPFREAVLSAPEGRKFIAHCAPAQSPRREGLPGPRAPSGRDGPRSSSVPEATSRPAKSPSRWPTVSKRSPSDDSVCAPRPRPSRRWSWHRWSTVKNTINF